MTVARQALAGACHLSFVTTHRDVIGLSPPGLIAITMGFTLDVLALFFCGLAASTHVFSVAVAAARCRRRDGSIAARPDSPSVTLILPVCGLDNYAEMTLSSAMTLDYPNYEVIFCVAHAHDPSVSLIESLLRRYPHIQARLLIGEHRINENPKLNNLVKGWAAAEHDWIAIADSNVLMPPDYIQRLFARWRSDTGLVCSPPAGARPENLYAEIECAFLNSYQARWQYTADTFGFGFAQGKTMFWRRRDLAGAGGIAALASETAEDAAATKLVRGLGLRVNLVDAPFAQPLGRRQFGEVWQRQMRWAQLRRASFTLYYAAEIFSSPVLAIICAALIGGTSAALLMAALWYGAELALAYCAGWPLSASTPIAMIARDLLLLPLWLAGWRGKSFVWRGNEMQTRQATEFVANHSNI